MRQLDAVFARLHAVQRNTLDSSLLVAAWPKAATDTDTWAEVYRALAWSFTALWDGYHPSKDWNGKAIRGGKAGTPLTPGGTRFYLWQLLGDFGLYGQCLEASALELQGMVLALQLLQNEQCAKL